eukprot:6206096-Pleurochrysis_carterae.AAC.1
MPKVYRPTCGGGGSPAAKCARMRCLRKPMKAMDCGHAQTPRSAGQNWAGCKSKQQPVKQRSDAEGCRQATFAESVHCRSALLSQRMRILSALNDTRYGERHSLSE